MEQIIQNFIPKGKVNLPSSKSYSHRALIMAYIANKKILIKDVCFCDDVLATLSCLEKMGGEFKILNNDVYFIKRNNLPSSVVLDAKCSGSTLRFLLPLASYLIKNVKFIGDESLFKRPLNVYEEILNKNHIPFEKGCNYIEIFDHFKVDDFCIDGSISSQFITGLLFLLTMDNESHYLKIASKLESKEYVDITLDVLNTFGVKFLRKDNLFIKKYQEYYSFTYQIEKDFSQLAFFAVLGCLNGIIQIENMNLASYQGDKRILDILMDQGGQFLFDKDKLTFYKSLCRGGVISLKDCIDLGPILMVFASFCVGKTIIKDAKRLRIKESDRISSMEEELKKAHVNITSNEDEIIIEGKASYQGDYIFSSHNDHRIAMALSIFAVLNKGTTTILNSECVSKSYQNFYRDLFSLKN